MERLPGESATKTAIRETMPEPDVVVLAQQRGHQGPWSHLELLLAAAIDRLGWIHAGLYRVQGVEVDYPDPWPRPGVALKAGRISPAGRAYLQRLRDEHVALHGHTEGDMPEG